MDLNLLAAMDALLREGSVVRAAASMGLSAPAMSRTLGRIRAAVGDPVFVRAGRGLVPTPRALAMRERVRALVEEGGRLLAPEAPIRPADFRRTFALRADDAGAVLLGPILLSTLSREAPGVVICFVPEGDEDVAALRDGTVDLDIGVQGPLGPEVRVQTLYQDEFVLLARSGGAFGRRRPTLARLAAADHIGVSREGGRGGALDELLAGKGVVRNVRLVVPTFIAAAALVARTDAVAAVPRSVARSVEPILDVVALPLPLPLSLPPITIAQAWHPRFDADPAHAWLRGQLREATAPLRRRT